MPIIRFELPSDVASGGDVAANTAAITALTARMDNRDQKDDVRVASLSNITLSGIQTIDGVLLVAGNRVAVMGQTLGQNNGIYVVSAGAWTRSTDADTSAKVTAGMFFFATEGTVNADKAFELTTNDPIVLGTTVLVFQQFAGALKTSQIVNDSTVVGAAGSDALNTLNAGKVDKLTPSKTIADAAYQFILADADFDLKCPFTVDRVITIPLNATVAFPVGQWLTGVSSGAGRANFVVAGGGTLTSFASFFTRTAGSPWALYQRSANVWELYGDLYL